jgi:alkanesulfonate monooxygenase SsuD/methylene tetrahydromethanopterin reductase-like flavin-dependent oxidoreductase (luciferase family)
MQSGGQVGAVMPVATMVAPVDIRDFAQAVEDMGFDYIVAWDHVLGADVSYHTPWAGPDTLVPIHEPFVLFGYLAAWTVASGLPRLSAYPSGRRRWWPNRPPRSMS